MDKHTSHIGHCLCGKVRVEAWGSLKTIGVCHCRMCRRWSGGPLMAIECGPDVTINGQNHVTTYSSSDWAERGFCQHCGTHIFWRLKKEGVYYLLPGLLDDEEGLVFDHQIFIDEKPSYYDFANKTKNMTGAEVVAAYEKGAE